MDPLDFLADGPIGWEDIEIDNVDACGDTPGLGLHQQQQQQDAQQLQPGLIGEQASADNGSSDATPAVNDPKERIRRERKREADRRCRKRKKDHVEELERKTKRLEAEKDDLMRQLAGAASSSNGNDEADVRQHLETRMARIRRIMQLFNGRDLEQLATAAREVYDETCTLMTPGIVSMASGVRAVVKFWSVLSESFPNGELQVENMAPEDPAGSKIDVTWKFVGTQAKTIPTDKLWATLRHGSNQNGDGGNGKDAGAGATAAAVTSGAGRQLSLNGHSFFSFNEEDKCVKMVVLWSTGEMLAQLVGDAACVSEMQQLAKKQKERLICASPPRRRPEASGNGGEGVGGGGGGAEAEDVGGENKIPNPACAMSGEGRAVRENADETGSETLAGKNENKQGGDGTV